MSKELDLSTACAALLKAERDLEALESYQHSLPADQHYDLGLRVDLAWWANTAGFHLLRAHLTDKAKHRLRLDLERLIGDHTAHVETCRNHVRLAAAE